MRFKVRLDGWISGHFSPSHSRCAWDQFHLGKIREKSFAPLRPDSHLWNTLAKSPLRSFISDYEVTFQEKRIIEDFLKILNSVYLSTRVRKKRMKSYFLLFFMQNFLLDARREDWARPATESDCGEWSAGLLSEFPSVFIDEWKG